MNSYRPKLTVAFIVFFCVAPPFPVGAAQTYLVDRIAAVVGSQIILFSDVLETAKPALNELEKVAQGRGLTGLMGGRRESVIKETLSQLIDDEIFLHEAREMKITVTQEELDAAMEGMARENGIDLAQLKQAIQAQGMDYLTYRNQLRKQLTRYKVLNMRVRSRIKISEAEARQHYNDQVRSIRATGTFEGAHILIRATSSEPAAKVAKAKQRAEELLKRSKAGEDFSALAKKESEDQATAPYGGNLGSLQPGQIPATLERAFFDLEANEIAGPIRTSAGFHVIKLIAREALGVLPFKEVKEKIIMDLQEEEMQRQAAIWLREQRSRIFIDVRL